MNRPHDRFNPDPDALPKRRKFNEENPDLWDALEDLFDACNRINWTALATIIGEDPDATAYRLRRIGEQMEAVRAAFSR